MLRIWRTIEIHSLFLFPFHFYHLSFLSPHPSSFLSPFPLSLPVSLTPYSHCLAMPVNSTPWISQICFYIHYHRPWNFPSPLVCLPSLQSCFPSKCTHGHITRAPSRAELPSLPLKYALRSLSSDFWMRWFLCLEHPSPNRSSLLHYLFNS